jgi:hypothetical protein
LNFPDTTIFIYDNGEQNIMEHLAMIKNNIPAFDNLKNVVVYGGFGQNTGVAASWNFLLQKAFAIHTHALVLNDDIYLHRTHGQIKLLLQYSKNTLALPEPKYNWSCFLMPELVFRSVGLFDEILWPAYYEDNDYERRISLSKDCGINIGVRLLNPTIYNNSMTLEKDPSIIVAKEACKKHYIQKWGGLPGEEVFLNPFNY